jgi:hypothetical protein
MRGHAAKIAVGRQHGQVVSNAQLREKNVDRAHLNPIPSASIPQFSGVDVVVTTRDHQRHGRESSLNLLPRFRPREALQKLLYHETCAYNNLAAVDGPGQSDDFRQARRRIAAQRERPYARINEQAQSRERSAL